MNFNKITIPDPEIDGITGATVLVPEGWTALCQFMWMPAFSMQGTVLLQVSEPRTGEAMYTLPTQQFCWSTQPMLGGFGGMQPGGNWLGSVMFPPPRDPRECIQWVHLPGALQHLQRAQLVKMDDLPGYALEVQRGLSPEMRVRATRLRHAYEWGGRRWEEDVYINIVYAQPNAIFAMWWCGGYALRAPQGSLDAATPRLLVPMLSLNLTLEWSAMLDHAQGLFRESVHKQQMDRSRKGLITAEVFPLGRIWRERGVQIREKYRPVWNAKQAVREREIRALRQAVPGLDTYLDPFDSHPVELPSEAVTYWANPEGRVVSSEEFSFDRPAGLDGEWRQMRRHAPTS